VKSEDTGALVRSTMHNILTSYV